MSSPYVDSVIRRHVIPSLDDLYPKFTPPKRKNKSLDTLEMLKEAIRYFNPEIFRLAVQRAFKSSNSVYVNDKKDMNVPHERIYDTELMRVLTSWLDEIFKY